MKKLSGSYSKYWFRMELINNGNKFNFKRVMSQKFKKTIKFKI